MSAVKSRSSLRTLVLTPERNPSFLILPRSPLLFASPRLQRSSPDRTRLLDQTDDVSGASPPTSPPSPGTSRRFPLRLLPRRLRRTRRAAAVAAESADTRVKVTPPYGFRAVLAASPYTRRRESLFHGTKPVIVTDTELPDPADRDPAPPGPSVPSGPARSRLSLRPVKALGVQMMRELKKPAAALKALSPAHCT